MKTLLNDIMLDLTTIAKAVELLWNAAVAVEDDAMYNGSSGKVI